MILERGRGLAAGRAAEKVSWVGCIMYSKLIPVGKIEDIVVVHVYTINLHHVLFVDDKGSTCTYTNT